MADLQTNTFSSWKLTLSEQREGSMYTITQTQVLQNQLAMTAEGKLALEFDPAEPELFMQAEAYKRGQLDLIQWMLAESTRLILEAESIAPN